MYSLLLLATICNCGVAPERQNDFYWDNDKFGMRAYGPGEYHKWSGFDVFNKMPDAASVGELLRTPNKGVDWHKEPWKGVLDNYTIGPSRGCGGIAIWADGEWKTYPDWESCEVIAQDDEQCEFKLVYPAASAMGKMTCHITLKRGDRFFRNEVTFEKGPGKDFRVGPGLDLGASRDHHGDVFEDPELGLVSLFEDPKNEAEGSTATAVFLDPSSVDGFTMMTDHLGCRVLATARKSFVYWAGAAWSKAGEITEAVAWHKTVKDFRREVILRFATSGK